MYDSDAYILLRMKNRGFTIIELLVVIAIIGILSSVIFMGLGGSRLKAKDTAMKQEMDQIRNRVEILYELSNNYGNAGAEFNCIGGGGNTRFTTDAELVNLILQISKYNGGVSPRCATGNGIASGAYSWAIKSALQNATAGMEWCMDSTGYRGEVAAASGIGGGVAAALCVQS